jgi:hypothetical protein
MLIAQSAGCAVPTEEQIHQAKTAADMLDITKSSHALNHT